MNETPDRTERKLADNLGMSVGSSNYCLNALSYKCLVKMRIISNSKNKFEYVYLLTAMGVAQKVALATRFLSRKMEECESLNSEVGFSSHDKIQKA